MRLLLEAALALVEVVREITRDVSPPHRRTAITTRSLVVAEVVVRNQIAPSASKIGPSSRNRGTACSTAPDSWTVVLVEVDVEVDAEVVQARLDVAEHELDAHRAEHLLLLIPRDVERSPG